MGPKTTSHPFPPKFIHIWLFCGPKYPHGPISEGCEQGPWAVHTTPPWARTGSLAVLYITIKSWALSGNPQRYTKPPLPSAEQCTVPFLINPNTTSIFDLFGCWTEFRVSGVLSGRFFLECRMKNLENVWCRNNPVHGMGPSQLYKTSVNLDRVN